MAFLPLLVVLRLLTGRSVLLLESDFVVARCIANEVFTLSPKAYKLRRITNF